MTLDSMWSNTNNISFPGLHDDVTAAVQANLTAPTPAAHDADADTVCGLGYTFFIRGVVLGAIVSFGLIGNMSSILVMRHDVMTSSTSLLLFMLAVVDILVLLTRLSFLIVPAWLEYWQLVEFDYQRFHENYVNRYADAFFFITLHWTAGMTVLVTAHRYVVVCYPTKVASWAAIRVVRKQIVVVLVAIFLYNVPLLCQYYDEEIAYDGGVILRPRRRAFTQSTAYVIFYRIILLYVVIYIIPVILLAVFSYNIVLTVHKTAEKMKQASSRSLDKREMTKTLSAIIICYVICQLPTPTNVLIEELTDQRFRACPSIYFYFMDLDDVSIVFNSAFNFVLYCLFGKRFRRHLRSILSGRRLRVEPLDTALKQSKATRDAAENQRLGSSTIATISRFIARRENN